MKYIAIAAILAITSSSATAKTCKSAEPEEANSGLCLLSIEGRMVVANERCQIKVSRDGHLYAMDNGRYQAKVEVNPKITKPPDGYPAEYRLV